MSFLLNFIFLFFFRFSLIESTTIIEASQGIKDITYDYDQNFTTFKIPIDQDNSISSLTLLLKYPYNINRTACEATCTKDTTDSSNIFYKCKITKDDCELLTDNKKIIIQGISPTEDCAFSNLKSMVSVLNFESSDIDMVCSNYKLSFWLTDVNLEYHPFDNLEFNFPIYYRDKKETADCIFPKSGKQIPCSIDASKRLFEKGYFINFEYDKIIHLNEDLNLTLRLNKYTLEDDCGKNINKGKMIYYKIYNSFNLFLLLSLLF